MFLTECPRDAMQGWGEFIPTQKKIDYLNALMAVNYDVLDCGSFVSPKAIPQMVDSGEVVVNIDKSISATKLSVIVANISGAEHTLKHKNVDILGFPFSISETFQHRNTNKNQEDAFAQILEIKKMATCRKIAQCVFFDSFWQSYGEKWAWEDVDFWAKRFSEIGVKNVLLSDTTSVATSETISLLFEKIPSKYREISFGAHFHNRYEDSYVKLKAAYDRAAEVLIPRLKESVAARWRRTIWWEICPRNRSLTLWHQKILITN